ncbi:MAG: bifunctional 3'-5' exonuclease/DNA polymerase, partial [Rothia mucilaginosa]|nr:bifunctional 3'-5' exonuclease/DNA polymerase [Rothia mucilaginosa]
MYILLSPATGTDITARTGTAHQPVTARIAASAPVRGRAENPVTSWGAFHYEDPTAEQLADPSFIPQILRADRVSAANLAAYVREVERKAEQSSNLRPPRWIWADTRHIAPLLLRRGVRVHQCYDLRLVQRILRTAATHPSHFVSYEPKLDLSELAEALEPQGYLPVARQIQGQEELFGVDFLSGTAQKSTNSASAPAKNPAQASGTPDFLEPAPHEPFEAQLSAGPVRLLPEHPVVRTLMSEWLAQARAVSSSKHPERLRLLTAAESAGALVAAEIGYYGI